MGIRDRGELCLTLCTLVLLHFNLMDGFLYTSLPPNKKDGKETGRKKGERKEGEKGGEKKKERKQGRKKKQREKAREGRKVICY